MAGRTYVGRYAQAVFNIALERNELDGWKSELEKLSSLGEDTAFVAAMESPKYPLEAKVKIISERLGDISQLALNLACILIVKGRFGMAHDVAIGYGRLLDSHRDIEQVEVTTAISLTDADKQNLTERLSAITHKKIELKSKVESSLIAGIIARIGGKLIDGSTRSQLLALKKDIAGSAG
ncbi:ATP synthase F1 subunit delta [Chloroflexota bacterium]